MFELDTRGSYPRFGGVLSVGSFAEPSEQQLPTKGDVEQFFSDVLPDSFEPIAAWIAGALPLPEAESEDNGDFGLRMSVYSPGYCDGVSAVDACQPTGAEFETLLRDSGGLGVEVAVVMPTPLGVLSGDLQFALFADPSEPFYGNFAGRLGNSLDVSGTLTPGGLLTIHFEAGNSEHAALLAELGFSLTANARFELLVNFSDQSQVFAIEGLPADQYPMIPASTAFVYADANLTVQDFSVAGVFFMTLNATSETVFFGSGTVNPGAFGSLIGIPSGNITVAGQTGRSGGATYGNLLLDGSFQSNLFAVAAEATLNVGWNFTTQSRNLSDEISELAATVTTLFQLENLDVASFSFVGQDPLIQSLGTIDAGTARLFVRGSLDVGPFNVAGTVAAQVRSGTVELYVSGQEELRQIGFLPGFNLSETGFARIGLGGIDGARVKLNGGTDLTLFDRSEFSLQGGVEVVINTTGTTVSVPNWASGIANIPAGTFVSFIVQGSLRFGFLGFEQGTGNMRMEVRLDPSNFAPKQLDVPFAAVPFTFDQHGNVGFALTIGSGGNESSVKPLRDFLVGMGLDEGPADWLASATTTLNGNASLQGYTPGCVPPSGQQSELMRDGGIGFDFSAGVAVEGFGSIAGEFDARFSSSGASGSFSGTASVLGLGGSVSGNLEVDGCATVDLLGTRYAFALTPTACSPAIVVSATATVTEGDVIDVVVRAFNLFNTPFYEYRGLSGRISVTSPISSENVLNYPLVFSDIVDGTAKAIYSISTVNSSSASERDIVVTVAGSTITRVPTPAGKGAGMGTEVIRLVGYPDRGRNDGTTSAIINVLDREMSTPRRPANAVLYYDFSAEPNGVAPQQIPLDASFIAPGFIATRISMATAVVPNGLKPDPDTNFYAAIKPLAHCPRLTPGEPCGIHFEFEVPSDGEATQIVFWDNPDGPSTKWTAHVEYSTFNEPFTVDVVSGEPLSQDQIPNLDPDASGWRKNEFDLPFDRRAFFGAELGPQLRSKLIVRVTCMLTTKN